MTFLYLVIAVVILIFGIVQYQSMRDRRRWLRIASGKSLFGDRGNDLPPLMLEGRAFEPYNRPILIIWSDLTFAGYLMADDARKQIARESRSGSAKAKGARLFAWDGKVWKPLSYTLSD